jgi:hypothetical protein
VISEWNVISLTDTKKPSLIELGECVKNWFDELGLALKADVVLVENQVAPLASNMKSLQCMIAQYFLMRDIPHTNIHFVPASLKLKGIVKKGSTYKERKALGITFCLKYIAMFESESNASKWTQFVQCHKKKDDLSDSYMQCIAFVGADK